MSAKIVFHCPCGQKLNVTPDKAGRTFVCPKCRGSVTVPGAAPSVVPQLPAVPVSVETPVITAVKKKPGETILYNAHPAMFRNNPIGFTLCFLLCFVVVGIPFMLAWYLRCLGTTLTVTDKRSTYRRGILSKSTSEVLHANVRNVQLSQSFLQRIFGVGSLGIASAGHGGTEIEISGIPAPAKVKSIIDEHC